MSRFTLDMQQLCRSLVLLSLAALAVVGSACGVDSDSLEPGVETSVQKEALDKQSCTLTEGSPPTLSIRNDVIVLKCGKPWKAPKVTAKDACGQPLEVHKYNTGDDDGDGIPGSIDPDDFGPGPDASTEGTYYVQYLAWDPLYNIASAILEVDVVSCHK
jgi:hypothetical protein